MYDVKWEIYKNIQIEDNKIFEMETGQQPEMIGKH
jgi:hypothetical protein